MDPGIISAGISVLGGMFGDDGYSPAQMSRGHIKGLMQAAEKFGISPLTLLNAGIPGGAVGKTNNMGAAFADAAMYLGDALAKKTDAVKLQQVAAERDRLQEKVVGLTIRPKVPGVYGPMRMGGPNAPTAVQPAGMGGSDDVGAPATLGANDRLASVPGVRPLAEVDVADPRREVDNKPVPSSSGVIKVDTPHLPFSFYVPSIDGDETFGPDLLTVPMAAAYGFGAWRGRQDAYKRGDAVWDEWKRKKEAKPSDYRFPQDSGYTVRKRKAPYLP